MEKEKNSSKSFFSRVVDALNTVLGYLGLEIFDVLVLIVWVFFGYLSCKYTNSEINVSKQYEEKIANSD